MRNDLMFFDRELSSKALLYSLSIKHIILGRKQNQPSEYTIKSQITGPVMWEALLCASYQIHKIASCACAGNAGNVLPAHRLQRKPLVSDPGMHHGMCVTHVPWCMSGSLTRGGGGNVPGIPGACATRNFTYLERCPHECKAELSSFLITGSIHFSEPGN